MHLHDGHPLWTGSPFAVRDHASWFERIPLPEIGQVCCLPMMFGPPGFIRIAQRMAALPQAKASSITIEIHPTEGREALGADADLFAHWRDTTSAERTAYWLSVLSRHAQLLKSAGKKTLSLS